jgi:hypothetical protein
MKKFATSLIVLKAAILLLISVFLCFINFYYGVEADIGSFDLFLAWNSPSLSNYMITLREALFDFDSFLGHFYENILLSMLTASQILYILDKKEMIKNSNENNQKTIKLTKNSRRASMIFFLVCALMLILSIIGSIFDLGYARPYLENFTIYLMLGNFYPQRFSEVFFVYLLFLAGFPLFIFSIGKANTVPRLVNDARNNSRLSMIAKMLYSISYFIVIMFILIFPIDRASIANGNSVLAMIYSVIALFLSLGLVELILIIPGKFSKENITERANISVIRDINTIKIKLMVGVAVAVVLLVYALFILQNPPFLQIGVVRFLQYLPSIIFRTCLTIAIVIFTISRNESKEGEL